jgi:hypothetical protein
LITAEHRGLARVVAALIRPISSDCFCGSSSNHRVIRFVIAGLLPTHRQSPEYLGEEPKLVLICAVPSVLP